MDMLIPATVSRTSTAGTESTTVDDVVVTGSVFGDDSTTGTPSSAHSHIITFRAMTDRDSSDNVGSAPPIPPRTNEMYLLEKRGTACAICIPASEDQTRDCFISEAHIAERGSDTESMSAWIEDAKTEVDRDMEFPEDTVSETSWDIGFPPPIPRRTQDMFLAQSFDPSDHATVQIPMIPNTSYTDFEPPEPLHENAFV